MEKRARREFPNDYWIVTTKAFAEYKTAEDAYAERARLRTILPDRNFRVVHCKRRIEKNERAIAVITRQRKQITALTALLAACKELQDERALYTLAAGVCEPTAAFRSLLDRIAAADLTVAKQNRREVPNG